MFASSEPDTPACPPRFIEQDELEKLVGFEQARNLWDLSLQSVRLVKYLIEQHQIDCDLTPGIIDAAHRRRYVHESHLYADKLESDYGYSQMIKLDQSAICEHIGTQAYYGGVLDTGSAHLHPLKYALGLAKAAQDAGVRIYEQSRVETIEYTDPAVPFLPATAI